MSVCKGVNKQAEFVYYAPVSTVSQRAIFISIINSGISTRVSFNEGFEKTAILSRLAMLVIKPKIKIIQELYSLHREEMRNVRNVGLSIVCSRNTYKQYTCYD